MVEAIEATRVIARPDALDSARVTDNGLLLRLAPDDALVISGEIEVDDPHAIIARDTGWVALSAGEHRLRSMLARLCAFDPRPGLNQGMVAGLPAKVWLDGDRSIIIVAAAFCAELEERFS